MNDTRADPQRGIGLTRRRAQMLSDNLRSMAAHARDPHPVPVAVSAQHLGSVSLADRLADRLAEAFAERLHQRVRTDLWGYAPGEASSLDVGDLIAEKYRGIRPAPGYPACPDHTEKRTLFRLLDVPALTGITLTESCAMLPTASVSGWYFWRAEARYFGTGMIGEDQVSDLADRKGVAQSEMARWLAPIRA